MNLRPYQAEARDAILREWDKGCNRTLLVLPTGCHAEGQKVLMANGQAKNVEDVQLGDRLLGADGQPRTVLNINRGTGPLYRIIPVKGDPFVVTGDHKLTLVRTGEYSNPKFPCQMHAGELVDVSVLEWLSWSENQKHLHKLIRCDGIEEFPGAYMPPYYVEPYFLGILLGDGGLKHSISVTTPDPEIVEELERQAKKFDSHLRTVPAGKATTYIFSVDKGKGGGRGGAPIINCLKELGVAGKLSGDKFVPEIYLRSSKDIRLDVLAGLIDTDGHLRCGGYDFISKSERLANDVVFLSRSCGLAAYVKKCTKGYGKQFKGEYYRVSISGNCSMIPCRVARKQSLERRQKKNVLRTGFSVEPAESGPYYGFTVDGDNRYLLDDFTITHNCGKTIVFSSVASDRVRAGDRVLILAHRGELLDQAADKLQRSTGLRCAVEKAEQSCKGSWYRVVVGSVQTLTRPARLETFPPDYFGTIIVDEAHHVLSDSYLRVMEHFPDAHVLGVTATPDRGDMKNLGKFFESLAYEYTMAEAIRDGWLCPIKALTIPLQLDLTQVAMQSGDFKVSDLGTALDPYLEQIADEMKGVCMDRKTVVFLPLIATSQKFRDILNSRGFRSAEVNGGSEDRAQILEAFDEGKYNVLCNSMLLTEGWDCPSVDCIVMLRPTKIRSLYCQAIGRGTRLCDGKDHLLVLDFLWHTSRHSLCRPAHLICSSEEIAEKMTEILEGEQEAMDIEEAEEEAKKDALREREEALAKELAEMRNRKRKLVDPIQYALSIESGDLADYTPSFGWESKPASKGQLDALEACGIYSDGNMVAGMASKLLDTLRSRRQAGLTSPKQIRLLERYGFKHVGTWPLWAASNMISQIVAANWHVPKGINPAEYVPMTALPGDEVMQM